MRRIFLALLCLVCLLLLPTPARADNAASNVQMYATVTTEGDCEVTMTVSLHLESPSQNLTFPLPLGATNIRRDGDTARTTHTGNAIEVDISFLDDFVGDTVVRFTYRMEKIVTVSSGELTLSLPLLSGFSYPVSAMKFDVMLPSKISTRPSFLSTYHQDSIESLIHFVVEDTMISGSMNTRLKDSETLSMTLPVTPAMFPAVSTYERTGNPEYVPMGICAALALLYWLLFLRNLPMLPHRRTTPPDGITAGELGSRLTLAGSDLTMMVISWAQMGYIMIHLDDNGRVLLNKRMDMGNERSSYENKVYKSLFGTRRVIDGTGYQYAQLAAKIARNNPAHKGMCSKRSGNPKIFRFLACLSHLFCGVLLGMNFGDTLAVQIVFSIFLGAFAVVSAWFMQKGMFQIHLRYKVPLWVSLGISAVWILLGILAGQWIAATLSVAGQLLAGLAAAYGGIRTELGRSQASDILGLRRYLKHMPQEDIDRLLKMDPDLFYNLLPYAMALGVGKAFSKNFGRRKLEQCPYFFCGISTRMNAQNWALFLHEAMDILDSRVRRMEWEKYFAIRIRV